MSVTSSGPLVDEQHDEDDFFVIGGDGVRDVLEKNRLARGAAARRFKQRCPLPIGQSMSMIRVE